MAAFHAESGAVYLQQGEVQLVQTAGAWSGDADVTVPLRYVSLGPRQGKREYKVEDRKTLEQIGTLAARSIGLARRTESS